MDFAEWVVCGLERHLAGPTNGTDRFVSVVMERLGGTVELREFMNSRSAASREALVRLVDAAVQQDPDFGHRLRSAGETAQQPSQTLSRFLAFLQTKAGMATVAVAVVAVGGLSMAMSSGGGGGSVNSSDICGNAKQLQAVTDDMGNQAYQAHLSDWHSLLDMAKKASDPKLASYARTADATDRNADDYYSSLNNIIGYSCG